MNLRKYLIHEPPRFLTGIPFIDNHMDISKPSIISVCSDNDMLGTGLLHYLAINAVDQNRFVCFIDAAATWNYKLYGISFSMAGKVKVLPSNSTEAFAVEIRNFPENSLILYDNLGMAYGQLELDEYMREFFAICQAIRSQKKSTVLFLEYFRGRGGPLSDNWKGLDYRVSIETVDNEPPWKNHTVTVQRGGNNQILAQMQLNLEDPTDTHRYFFQQADQKT